MEVTALAQRILLDIDNVFKKDPNIDEFDILPVLTSTQNKSPVISQSHKLGLEAWCTQHLYMYSYNQLMVWRKSRNRTEVQTILGCTRILVLLNPDLTTAWNVRKELLLSGYIDEKDELELSRLCLTFKPKSAEAFIHRRWNLLRLFKRLQLEGENAQTIQELQNLLQEEFNICTLTAIRHFSNYNSWCHRMWVVQNMSWNNLSIILESELEANEQWLHQNVSDYSGMQYRQNLISLIYGEIMKGQPLLIDKSDEADLYRRAKWLLKRELCLISNMMVTYTHHEALWNHRRYVLYTLLKGKLLYSMDVNKDSMNCGTQQKKFKSDLSKFSNEEDSEELILVEERKFLLQFAEESLQNEYLSNLIRNYKRWVSSMIGLSL